jgi:EpsD family peptidyl-prolyl cis-trans isomerase
MTAQVLALPFKATLLAATLALLVAACGDKSDKKPAATQVAAKVNGSEISVHQINAVLSKAQGVTAENAAQAKQEILGKLIDQQLAFDQAVDKKLDRNPDVMMAIESAKREIVARAYLDQLVSAQPKPSVDEANKYYAENPSLFANRRVYNIQEITLEAKPEVLDSIKQMASSGKSMDDIASFLKGKGVNFRGGAATRPAEQIPLEVLPRLSALRDGQAIVVEAPQNYLVMRVAASQSAPVDEVTARPRIQLFLHNQRAQKVIEEDIKRLKTAAKIEFQGEFAAKPADAAVAEAVPVKPAAKPATKPAAEAKPAGSSSIEKGVAGLK